MYELIFVITLLVGFIALVMFVIRSLRAIGLFFKNKSTSQRRKKPMATSKSNFEATTSHDPFPEVIDYTVYDEPLSGKRLEEMRSISLNRQIRKEFEAMDASASAA